jgi:hypothetical protein
VAILLPRIADVLVNGAKDEERDIKRLKFVK